MRRSLRAWFGVGRGALGLFMLVEGWLLAIQAFLGLMAPVGHWQAPAIGRAWVVAKDRDPENGFTDPVRLRRGGRLQDVRMLKSEARSLQVGEERWVLNSTFVSPVRPDVFQLTPQRLLVEYPWLGILMALGGLFLLRRAEARVQAVKHAAEPRPRRILTDDFHRRADRFARSSGSDSQGPSHA